MAFLATSNEEDLLTHEVSDEALERAGENEVAGNYTLANLSGTYVGRLGNSGISDLHG